MTITAAALVKITFRNKNVIITKPRTPSIHTLYISEFEENCFLYCNGYPYLEMRGLLIELSGWDFLAMDSSFYTISLNTCRMALENIHTEIKSSKLKIEIEENIQANAR